MRIGLLISFCVLGCLAAELPRHGVIGLAVGPPDVNKPEDLKTNPPSAKVLGPGSAAEAAGIQVGDVLRELDGVAVKSSTDFAGRVTRHLGGEQVTVVIERGGERITKTVTLKPRPYEVSNDAEVIYGSVSVDGARRRTIITRPKAAGRYPAVLLIGGLGCYSLDGELRNSAGYGPVLQALAKNGYVTLRVEKPGQGDSEGPACTDPKATAELEARGYVAGLRELKKAAYVDPARVFVFAHSLGPLVGSMVINEEPVRGFVAVATVGRSWLEYELDNVRRQSALDGKTPDEVDARVREHARCAFRLYVQHQTDEEVAASGPQCAEMITSHFGVPYTFMQQIGDLSLGKQWKQPDIPVLVIYGTADPVTSAEEGRMLAETINRWHPGRASYLEIAGMGHNFLRFASQAEFLKRHGDGQQRQYCEEMVSAVVKWLGERGE